MNHERILPSLIMHIGRILILLQLTGCNASNAATQDCTSNACPTGSQCTNGTCLSKSCTPGEQEPCDQCGIRTCGNAGLWGACADQRNCSPGQSKPCGAGGTMTCDSQCEWQGCTASCTAGEQADCGNCGTMTCDPTGKWGACTDGPCQLDATEACSACSARSCKPVFDSESGKRTSCAWSECLSNCEPGKECQAGSCAACGAAGAACCEGSLCDGDLECAGTDGNTCVATSDPDGGVEPDAGEDPDAGASGDGGSPGCTFAPKSSALILYYGTMQDSSGWRDDLNFKLATPKLDVVFVVGGGNKFTQSQPSKPGDPGTGEFKAYHDHCLRIAFHMGTAQIQACLHQRSDLLQEDKPDPVDNPCASSHVQGANGAEDLAAYWKEKLDLGWDYIAIDEIKSIDLHIKNSSNTLSTSMMNDTDNVKLFSSALAKLANKGYDKAVITFFVPHNNTPCTSPPPYAKYKDFFVACRDHCRTIMHEWYFYTSEVEQGAAKSFKCIADSLHDTGVTDINRVTTMIIAAGSDKSDWSRFDDPPCDISPWPAGHDTCSKLPNSGGIKRQLDAMHASTSASRFWWGVGFYKLGAVTTGSLNGTQYWNRNDFAESTAARVNWWATHPKP